MRTVNIHGSTFSVEAEPADYWNWIEQGNYRSELDTITRFSGSEVTCIDAGAWVGAYTLYASKLYKHVHALEPDPVAFQILSKNVQANGLTNVTLYELALH